MQKIINGELVDMSSAEIAAHEAAQTAAFAVVPVSITRLQGRLALLNAGLLATAESAINAAGGATLIWYQDAQTWERSNPILTDLGTAIGLFSEDIDDLFRQAATL